MEDSGRSFIHLIRAPSNTWLRATALGHNRPVADPPPQQELPEQELNHQVERTLSYSVAFALIVLFAITHVAAIVVLQRRLGSSGALLGALAGATILTLWLWSRAGWAPEAVLSYVALPFAAGLGAMAMVLVRARIAPAGRVGVTGLLGGLVWLFLYFQTAYMLR
jgi:hypothetical protein